MIYSHRKLKNRLYACSWAKEHWIVDPDKETIEVFTLKAEGYKSDGIYDRKDKLKSLVLKGLSINVNEVFL